MAHDDSTPEGSEKIVLGGSKLIVSVPPNEFALFDQKHNYAPLDDKMSRSMLSGSRVAVMGWGTPCIGLEVDGELLSINATSMHKKAKNAYGRYINVYLAYTVPEHRYKGYATMLLEHLERQALEQGCKRMKSLAGSWAGVRLHMHFGHHFYGVARLGELVVDTPLQSGLEFPEGIPVDVRNRALNPHILTREELYCVLLTSDRFKDTVAKEKDLDGILDRYEAKRR